jgi:hypothetical protein
VLQNALRLCEIDLQAAAATARGVLDELVTRLFQDWLPEWERQRFEHGAPQFDG